MFQQNFLLPYLAMGFCWLLGFLLLLHVTVPNDGGWFLYAQAILKGERLYTDMQTNLQPLFPLLSIIPIYFFDNPILQKIPYSFIFFGYVYAIFALSKNIWGNNLEKSLFVLVVTLLPLHFIAFRMDDYHVLWQLCTLYSILFSSNFLEKKITLYKYTIIQSILSTLAILTHITSGMTIVLSIFGVALYKEGFTSRLVKCIFLGMSIFCVIFLLVLLCLNESPIMWFQKTILIASQAKGNQSLLTKPIYLFKSARDLGFPSTPKEVTYFLFFIFLIFFTKKHELHLSIPKKFFFSLFIAYIFYITLKEIISNDFIYSLTVLSILITFCFLGYFILKMIALNNKEVWKPNKILITYPVFSFCFSSLSSGGSIWGLYFPAALSLITLNILRNHDNKYLFEFIPSVFRTSYQIILIIIFSQCLIEKVQIPYQWHSYTTSPLCYNIKVTTLENKGKTILENEMYDFLKPICEITNNSESLLSLPYSAANYYCEVPIYKNYIQTFFDTSTKETIQRLIDDLKKSPPLYILYQRQLSNLEYHERQYNNGKPLPHRELDSFIWNQLIIGNWQVVYMPRQYKGSVWYLIKTKPLNELTGK